MTITKTIAAVACAATLIATPAVAADDGPEVIFKKNTVFHLLSPDAKLGTYVIDDPSIEGVACYFTVPEQGGWAGWAGLTEQRSETSIACRQIGPVKINAKFAQGADMYAERRSMFFKTMHISRGCDAKRNVLVYLSYSDKLIDGSPQNSTSTVPLCHGGQMLRQSAGILCNHKLVGRDFSRPILRYFTSIVVHMPSMKWPGTLQ